MSWSRMRPPWRQKCIAQLTLSLAYEVVLFFPLYPNSSVSPPTGTNCSEEKHTDLSFVRSCACKKAIATVHHSRQEPQQRQQQHRRDAVRSARWLSAINTETCQRATWLSCTQTIGVHMEEKRCHSDEISGHYRHRDVIHGRVLNSTCRNM